MISFELKILLGMRIKYKKSYFALQLEFVERIARILGEPESSLLASYTTIKRMIPWESGNGIGGSWDEFKSNYDRVDCKLDFVYATYADRCRGINEESRPDGHCSGYFRFDYPWRDTNLVRIHFGSEKDPVKGVLSRDNIEYRKRELRGMALG